MLPNIRNESYQQAILIGILLGFVLFSIWLVFRPSWLLAYGQSSYYGEGAYYGQSTYYAQSTYYSQGSYAPPTPTLFSYEYETNGYCAKVVVTKSVSNPRTVIHADGYNVADCDNIATSPRALQRSVELSY